MPTVKSIVAANQSLVRDLELLDPWEECWKCRHCPHKLIRAHVVARSGGGSDAPDNFFLLCDDCHRLQPDGAPRPAQDAWIRMRAESRVTRCVTQVVAACSALDPGRIEEWLSADTFGNRIAAAIELGNKAGGAHGRANVSHSTAWSFYELYRQHLEG